MKKFLMFLCAVMLVFGMVGTASAVPMTWTDTIDWDPDEYLNATNDSVSYTHDITDDGFDPWLDGNSTYDVIGEYTLTVSLYDDDNTFEAVMVDQPGTLGDTFQTSFSWEDEVTGWSILGLVQLNCYGTLDVTITHVVGDFYLDCSTLVVNGYDMTAPVPEPSTILLMGSGLLGLVGYSRKRFSKKS